MVIGQEVRGEMEIKYRPIGVIHSPFKTVEGVPIQPAGAVGIRGTVEVFPEFVEGLKDLEGFSHIILIYHFHRVKGYQLEVTPFLDERPHGVFATRAPRRPNAIGLSVVRLVGVEGGVLEVDGVDVLDGTPLLDIKPYVPEFDVYEVEKVGWLEERKEEVVHRRSDGRFRSL
jgi:tRNA-Thr(GGU) m(6)t(6)A37 methyltransferase TsaA